MKHCRHITNEATGAGIVVQQSKLQLEMPAPHTVWIPVQAASPPIQLHANVPVKAAKDDLNTWAPDTQGTWKEFWLLDVTFPSYCGHSGKEPADGGALFLWMFLLLCFLNTQNFKKNFFEATEEHVIIRYEFSGWKLQSITVLVANIVSENSEWRLQAKTVKCSIQIS